MGIACSKCGEYVAALHIHKCSNTDVKGCFSCDNDFMAECHNDRDEGYFCDDCLDNKELAN